MYNYRRISNIAEEEGLLQEMLNLQSQIRAQREKDRIAKTSRSEKYTKMFEPVTKSLERLVTPILPATNDLVDLTDVIPGHVPLQLKEEKDDFELMEPGELYREALNSVPIRRRDDGMLGLNTEKHSIGDYIYEVEGNVLKVHHDGEQKHFEIDDLELWKLLLVKNPQSIRLKLKDEQKQYLPFVHEFKDIADQLNLVASSGHRTGFKNRVKYKMLMEMRKGSGFLFSVQPPVTPNTVVIPSDNLGLMRALYTALAELRAGNTSMRNIVVPLAAEAKRKRILPENLLSPDEETWVYA